MSLLQYVAYVIAARTRRHYVGVTGFLTMPGTRERRAAIAGIRADIRAALATVNAMPQPGSVDYDANAYQAASVNLYNANAEYSKILAGDYDTYACDGTFCAY